MPVPITKFANRRAGSYAPGNLLIHFLRADGLLSNFKVVWLLSAFLSQHIGKIMDISGGVLEVFYPIACSEKLDCHLQGQSCVANPRKMPKYQSWAAECQNVRGGSKM